MSHRLTVSNNKLVIDNKHFDEYLKDFDFNERLYNISKKKNIIELDHNTSTINITHKQYRKLLNNINKK
jgi:hypothetical protein